MVRHVGSKAIGGSMGTHPHRWEHSFEVVEKMASPLHQPRIVVVSGYTYQVTEADVINAIVRAQ